MEKSDNKKKILTIIASVIALIILVSASYAFFGSMKINTNNNATSRIDTKFYTFNTSGNQNVALTINESDLDVGSASNDYTSYVESNSNLTLTLDAKGDAPVYCSYDIVYVPSTSYTPSQSTLKEYAVRGSSNQGHSFNDVSLGGSSKIKIYSGSIETTTSQTSISETWNFNLRYYNLNIAQDNSIIGKTFGGNIKVENIDCDFKEYANNLYSIIARKYLISDEHVKLYNGSDYGDTTKYANNIYYFNGNVENNNVLFGGYCWKIVRTTDTGGVKIVYNGVQKDVANIEPINQDEYINVTNDAIYPYTFDETNKTWTSTNHDHSKTGTITFSVKEDGDYYLNYSVSSETCCDKVEFINGTTSLGKFADSGTIALKGLTTSNVITVKYSKDSSVSKNNDNVVFSIGKAVGDTIKTCNNTGTYSQIGTSRFNSDDSSVASVGYMYNTVYTNASKFDPSQVVFGNSFTYEKDNNTYTLKDTMTVASWSNEYNTINNNHYTCMTAGTTCTEIFYVYQTYESYAYYITLTGGKSVEDALNEMLYADDVNTNDSVIKAYIDSWYEKNIKNKYDDKLEDTIFCNDRSILKLGGWNPNGGSTTSYHEILFKNNDTSNKSLECTNETDRFSVNNPKAQLKYPIGLLTVPELSLANYGSSHYFNNGLNAWLGSPYYYGGGFANFWIVKSSGFGNNSSSGGVRPSISLKQGTEITKGDGSYTNPFVVE